MKRFLHYLGWLAKLLVFLVVLGFALKNSQPVTFVSYLGYEWQAPLIVMLLIAFLLGAIMGLVALLPYLIRLRRQAGANRKALAAASAVPSSDFPE